jgi:ATP-binding cassette subfamily B protein
MVNSLFFPIVMALIGLSVILTVFVGGNEVISGALTFGNIAEFILYVNYLTWPVTALGWISSITQRAAASQRRINEFMLVKNDITSEKNIQQEIRGDIEFNGVSFTYPESGIVALSSLDFKLNSGESLAIIGTTGSGKSLYDPTEGKITIDEINLKDYHLGSIRSQIGYVPQDVFLFSDTIFNNIAFGSMEIPPEKVMQAARDADLYGNVMDFPDQFNTRVGERGITLSGGQKQRVSIARAIVRDPKILILDDSLSAVDTKTENTILKSMKLLMKDRTTIIISHRVSSAKLADKIIVLDDGVIVEQGTNESLLKSDGVYRSLYEKQLLAEELLED